MTPSIIKILELMKINRKSILSLFMSFLILFTSCEQYDNDINAFDLSAYNAYKQQFTEINFQKLVDNSRTSNSDIDAAQLMTTLNEIFGSNIELSNEILQFPYASPEELKAIGLSNNYFNQEDIIILNKFIEDLHDKDFITSLNTFQSNVLELNINNEKFENYNEFVNMISLIQEANIDLFDLRNPNKGWVACALATLWLAYTTVQAGRWVCKCYIMYSNYGSLGFCFSKLLATMCTRQLKFLDYDTHKRIKILFNSIYNRIVVYYYLYN